MRSAGEIKIPSWTTEGAREGARVKTRVINLVARTAWRKKEKWRREKFGKAK